jgi:hypothetical protein
MSYFCREIDENTFTCRSSFSPYVPPVEQISLEDNIPESVKEERKKSNGIEYLPGEKLLIQIAKQRKKARTIDVDRISKSLSRVLLSNF